MTDELKPVGMMCEYDAHYTIGDDEPRTISCADYYPVSEAGHVAGILDRKRINDPHLEFTYSNLRCWPLYIKPSEEVDGSHAG